MFKVYIMQEYQGLWERIFKIKLNMRVFFFFSKFGRIRGKQPEHLVTDDRQ